MTLPEQVRAALDRATGARVLAARAVGGGCISPAFRVRLHGGTDVFVKVAADHAPDLFVREAYSLACLAATGAVRVPAVIAATPEFLALEWLEPASASATDWSALGRALAALHCTRAASFGWATDNYIGPLPQSNAPLEDWPAFWRERRLLPQLERAATQLGRATVSDFERLLARLDVMVGAGNDDGASLLHGDLWRGNVHFTSGGAALVDPSCSSGHREVDLAMAALFGGFAPTFFAAYHNAWPLRPGSAARRPVYQLYYLLVHVNLFGSGYIEQTRTCLAAALRAQ